MSERVAGVVEVTGRQLSDLSFAFRTQYRKGVLVGKKYAGKSLGPRPDMMSNGIQMSNIFISGGKCMATGHDLTK